MKFEIIENEKHYISRTHPHTVIQYGRSLLIETALVSVYTMLRTLAGKPLKLISLSISYDSPYNAQEYQRYFNCPIKFNEPYCDLLIDREFIQADVVHANPTRAYLFNEWCQQEISQLHMRQGLLDNLTEYIEKFSDHYPTLDQAAKAMCMSARNLNRKLAKENLSFSQVVAKNRMEKACLLLTTTSLSSEQIGFSVGFNSSSNFTRAFKKWMNCTPGKYRENSLADKNLDPA